VKRLLIHQPGANGDILICLPIAHWYSKEYQVDWLCPERYHLNFRNIDYCRPVAAISGHYDKFIDMSFGICTETDLHKWWMDTKPQWQSFINAKYFLAGIPLLERWKLVWTRDESRERRLYKKIINHYGSEYVLCHEASFDGSRVNMEFANKVPFVPVEDFNVFDWYQVIQKAREVYCIDSVLCNFIEVVPEFMKLRKVYYLSPKIPNLWDRTILTNNWNIVRQAT